MMPNWSCDPLSKKDQLVLPRSIRKNDWDSTKSSNKINQQPQNGESLPVLTTGQLFLHSWRHFLGLHLSELTIAIRVNLWSDISLNSTVYNQDKANSKLKPKP